MLLHTVCGNTARVDISNAISFVGDIAMARDLSHIRIVGLTIKLKKNYTKTVGIILECEKCGTIPIEEVGGVCMICGDRFTRDKIFIPVDSGGTYCLTHIKRNYSDEGNISLAKALEKKVHIQF